jgi:GPH family glycoside/pentoside/hexuronide:cation symporter
MTPRKSAFAYARVSFGTSLTVTLVSTYVMYFYTDVLLLPTGAVAALTLAVRLFDGVVDPFIGHRIDARLPGKYGKFRGIILRWCVPLAALTSLLFLPPPFSGGISAFVWCFLTYLAWSLAYSFIEVAQLPLLAAVARRGDLGRMSGAKIAASVLGALVASAASLPLVRLIGAGDERRGFALTGLAFSLVTLCAVFSGIRALRESETAAGGGSPMRYAIRALWRDKSLAVVLAVFTLDLFATALKNQGAIYYIKYCMGAPESVTRFLLVCLLTTLAVQPLIYALSKRRSPVTLMAGGYALSALAIAAVPLARSMPALIAIGVLHSAAAAFPANLVFLRVAGLAVDISEREGTDLRATINSLLGVTAKVGSSAAGAALLSALSVSGYVANAEQTPNAQLAIRVCFIWATAAVLTLCAALTRVSRRREA